MTAADAAPTAKKGSVSRIVPRIADGAAVTTMRADVDYVVTEHGVAHLKGKRLRERAEALIEITDPAFRDELIAGVKALRGESWLPVRAGSRSQP